jgi:hypothetical protein
MGISQLMNRIYNFNFLFIHFLGCTDLIVMNQNFTFILSQKIIYCLLDERPVFKASVSVISDIIKMVNPCDILVL